MNMKLYVWEDVLCEWACGMAFAIAESKKQAIETLGKEGQYIADELNSIEPKVFKLDRKTPISFYIHGGG